MHAIVVLLPLSAALLSRPVTGGSRSSASSSTIAPESIKVVAAIAWFEIMLLVVRNLP
ncbi:MAG TPA: hypothetical protein VG497_12500 [Kribbella sp.]|nr:hypothetical protein [Kribbella sp.]